MVNSLYDYWQDFPPTHIATRYAWFTDEPKEKNETGDVDNDAGNVQQALVLPGMKGNWVGPPPMTIADVEAARARAKSNG